MIIHGDGKKRKELREEWVPVAILGSYGVTKLSALTTPKTPCISFQTNHCAKWEKAGAWVLLDFGKELCGGIRIVTREVKGTALFRLTFGESVTEACSTIGGANNATNDHSPRDIEVCVASMSDLQFGQTGFRFARIELISENPVLVQSVYAVSLLPVFEREAIIVTNDTLLNQIIDTAAYTLKLNFQNSFIWDGIKRDRLVWCGDLHPEILTSLYLFGDTPNVKNSLSFLCEETPETEWVNNIPTYSAWWVVNLCDYCTITGNEAYFNDNRSYAISILEHLNENINEAGELCFDENRYGMAYFLDWSTFQTEDSKVGVASLLCFAAKKFLDMEENAVCREIIMKLKGYLGKNVDMKPVRAFQILAGRDEAGDDAFLQANGAHGMSTFMAYYILTATSKAGGTGMLDMLKSYYGGMLSRGATSFWEDFDLAWLEGSGRIDCLPKDGEIDLHADHGNYCYKNLRHSLCHGWSAGVVAFIVEYIVGVKITDGGRTVTINPHLLGLTDIDASIPLTNGILKVSIHNDNIDVTAPEGIDIIIAEGRN